MPTISGMRRRGYKPEALRNFCDGLAVAKTDGTVDIAQLEYEIRSDLNDNALRAMCVLNPVKVILENYEQNEILEVANHPQKEEAGKREIPFSNELYIDRADFSEDTTLGRKKFKRLVLGDYVRLRGAYVIQATDVVKDANGDITEIKAQLVEGTLGENPPAEQKPRGVIHWVDAKTAREVEVRVYDRLFTAENPDKAEEGYLSVINPESLVTIKALLEPAACDCAPETGFQFEREGYYTADRFDHTPEKPVFNKTIGLREGN
jgi:glutaminyl-tRNA synthetase